MAVVVIIIITGGVMAVTMAVVATAVIIAPRKGSGENPEKSSPRRKGGVPSGLLIRKGIRVRVISAPLDTSPT